MVLCMSQVDRTQAAFGFQHRGDTLNALNRRFAVDLSGARLRHWKSEVLSIGSRVSLCTFRRRSVFVAQLRLLCPSRFVR
jgi:hypothetical protein